MSRRSSSSSSWRSSSPMLRRACAPRRSRAIGRARTTEVALRVQPQARRRRHARRRAVGDRLSDRLMLKVRVVLLLPEDGSIAVKAGYPPEDTLDEADLAAAKWAWENDRPAGRGSDTLPGAKRLFLPMRTGRGAVGVVGIDSDKPGPLLTPDAAPAARRADRSGGARDRAGASGRGHGPRQAHGRDRSAALGAAHLDLARPEDAARRDPRRGRHAARPSRQVSTTTQKADLLATIIDESERLNRFIANLLDMTKLESGAVAPNAALHDLGEIVGSALRRAGKILAQHRGRARARRRPADARARCRAVRAGAVQPARQCREICAGRHRRSRSRAGATESPSRCRSSTRATAFRRRIWSRSSTSSIGRRRATRCAPAPGSALRSARGFVEAMHGTIAAANRTDRSGRGVHHQAAGPRRRATRWTPPHERRPAQGPGRSTTSRRSASCCAWA